jgi:hypothetical protein
VAIFFFVFDSSLAKKTGLVYKVDSRVQLDLDPPEFGYEFDVGWEAYSWPL